MGIVLFLGIIFLFAYGTILSFFKKLGFKNVNSIKDMKNEVENIKTADSTRVRSISGMTSLLLPQIRKDFPGFNENELYAKAESDLKMIFESLETKNKNKIIGLNLLESSIKNTIDDYAKGNIDVRYDDLKFHKYSIYQYMKEDGIATITICLALEYYYQKQIDGKIIEEFTKYKNQTRYKCKYIYIYDAEKVSDSAKALAINCPNCGASIKALGYKYCDYCGTGIREVNLKSWELSSYEEF